MKHKRSQEFRTHPFSEVSTYRSIMGNRKYHRISNKITLLKMLSFPQPCFNEAVQSHLCGNWKISRLTVFMPLCTCVLTLHQLSLQISVDNDSRGKNQGRGTTSGFPQMVPFRHNKKVTMHCHYVVGRTKARKTAHIPTLRTCEDVTWHSRRVSADAVTLNTLSWGDQPDHPGGPSIITGSL